MDLIKIIGCSCRRRILEELSSNSKITIMKLVRAVNSTYNEVDRNLAILEDEGVIIQKYVSNKRYIALDYSNEKTFILIKSIEYLKIADNRYFEP
jgi:DNA-binding transcriptional ArsR family regulator